MWYSFTVHISYKEVYMDLILGTILPLIGGLCLFLFGMNLMGQGLERRAGNKLRGLLEKMTSNRFLGFLTGLGVTAVIQSSSATTVMVVGFVNSSIMTLRQAINVIIGANVGTTVTSWILSLGGINGKAWYLQILKPSSFTPVLALVGIILYMFCKSQKKKETATILLGFATLMFGMEAMSDSVGGLGELPWFQDMLIAFSNPLLGVLAGAVLTAIIQSSSASVGILQALSATGKVTLGASIPIIMGQSIGTCITAMFSAIGATKNAKRAAMAHLFFNVIGTSICLSVFWIVKASIPTVATFLTGEATHLSIAICLTGFKVICTAMFLPTTKWLEKLVRLVIRDAKTEEHAPVLDERLLATPAIALGHARKLAVEMAKSATDTLSNGISILEDYTPERAKQILQGESECDHYEDILGTFLVKLSAQGVNDDDSAESAELLRIIGDLERISDHGKNLLESAEELRDKGFSFSDDARTELARLTDAIHEVLSLSLRAFVDNDVVAAREVGPLEDVIDDLKEDLRTRHITRLQQGKCSIEVGFVWSDLLTNLERTADHCANIALCVIDRAAHNMNIHEADRLERENDIFFTTRRREYADKYTLAVVDAKE